MLIGIGIAVIALIVGVGAKGLFGKSRPTPSQNTKSMPLAVKLPSVTSKVIPYEEPNPPEKEVKILYPRDLRRMQQYLKRQDIKLKDKVKELLDQQKEIEFGKLLIDTGQEHIRVQDDRIKNSKQEIDIEKREALNDIQKEKLESLSEQVQAKSLKVDLIQKLYEIDHERNQLKLDLRQIELIQQANKLELDGLLHQIEVLITNVELREKAFDLTKRESLAEIKESRLEEFKQYIDYDYKLKLKAINLRELEQNVSFREKKLELSKVYHATTTVIDKLRYNTTKETDSKRFWRQEEYLRRLTYNYNQWLTFY